MEKNRALELVLGMMFLVLVFVMVIIGIGASSSGSKTSVSNSYNTYNYCEDCEKETLQPIIQRQLLEAPVYISKRAPTQTLCKTTYLEYSDEYIRAKSCESDNACYWTTTKKDYSQIYEIRSKSAYVSEGNHLKEQALGGYADTFRVWIENKGVSDYFTVKYYFSDCSGNVKTYEQRRYVSSGSREEFRFRDVSRNVDAYCSWKYVVDRS